MITQQQSAHVCLSKLLVNFLQSPKAEPWVIRYEVSVQLAYQKSATGMAKDLYNILANENVSVNTSKIHTQ